MKQAMLDLDLLRSFVSVVDAGGFTRAGERVHRTQSTVSQQIRRLEDSLGRELLHRNGKQATPTEEGERLLSYARRILAHASELFVVGRRIPPVEDQELAIGKVVAAGHRQRPRHTDPFDPRKGAQPRDDGVHHLDLPRHPG